MSSARHWLRAFRLRTLPLAVSCIAMGSFLAFDRHAFRWDIFLLCVVTTVFLQVLSNLSNDYGDSVHGADSDQRLGPSRAVQSGVITSGAMRAAIVIFSILSLGSGLALLFVAFGTQWDAILFFLALGLLSIAAAVAYTVGRKPYGYLGLGDVSVFVFFGLVGVLGSYYLFTRQIPRLEVLPAASMGFLSVAVLNVNNIRDIDSDRRAGKFSIPVRIGRRMAGRYHWGLLLCAVLATSLYTIFNYHSPWQFLFMLAIPLLVWNGSAVSRLPTDRLDPYLRQMAMTALLFSLLFGAGLMLG